MILKKISFILLPVVFFLLTNVIFSDWIHENYIYPVRYKHDLFPKDDERFDYAVVGNSHARDSFNFELSDQEGINLALSAQKIYWSNQLLQKYNDHFDDDTIIIVALTYDELCQSAEFGQVRYVPLGFNATDIKISYENYILEKHFPLIGIDKFWESFSNGFTHFADVQNEYPYKEALEQNANDYFASRFGAYDTCDQQQFMETLEMVDELLTYLVFSLKFFSVEVLPFNLVGLNPKIDSYSIC